MRRDYDKIKDTYGESMAKMCRRLFPGIMEKGELYSLLISKFSPNRFLCDDIVYGNRVEDFENYIFSLCHLDNDYVDNGKSVRELFNEKDYDFFECLTYSDIIQFMKYYEPEERLCTFHEDRLSTHFVFWIVKKNVDEIKREDFEIPSRDDLYSTSVLSLQFSRGICNNLSIKSRYNHTVADPDAILSNDLDRINEGLTKAFEREYSFNITSFSGTCFNLNGYVLGSDRRFYKFNLMCNGIYYCPDNIIIDHGKIIKLDTSRYLLVDYFIIDMKDKKIKLYDMDICDSFVGIYNDIMKIKVLRDTDKKLVTFYRDNGEIVNLESDKFGNIIGFEDYSLKNLGNGFMRYNKCLERLNCPNLENIGFSCLSDNLGLRDVNLENVKVIGDNFLNNNIVLMNCDLSSVRIIGNGVLSDNYGLLKLDLLNVVRIGNDFCSSNEAIKSFNAPLLKELGDNCLYINSRLRKIDFPSLISLGDNFMYCNKYSLKEFSAPKLRIIGREFLYYNTSLREVYLPNLEVAYEYFMANNKLMENFNFPSLCVVNNGFLEKNKYWKSISDNVKRRTKAKKTFVRRPNY